MGTTKDDQERLRDIEEWFRERGVTLEYQEVGDQEWVAMMVPDDGQYSLLEGGGGRTKLAAAEDAQRKLNALHGNVVRGASSLNLGFQIHSAGAVVEAPAGGVVAGGCPPAEIVELAGVVHERAIGVLTVTHEAIDKIAGEFGWYFAFVHEPDGSFRGFRFDRDRRTLLKTAVAETLDDALLAMVEDLQPPSDEGRE